MYCKYCGSKVEGNARFCENCGHEINTLKQIDSVSASQISETQEDKYAIIGFALGLASLSMPIVAIPGIIFSIKGKNSEKRKTLASVGLGVSIASIVLFTLFLFLYILLITILIRQ